MIRTSAAAVIFSASSIVTSMVSAGAQNVRVRAARAEEPRAASAEERTVSCRASIGVGVDPRCKREV
jgi:hypothetical protein